MRNQPRHQTRQQAVTPFPAFGKTSPELGRYLRMLERTVIAQRRQIQQMQLRLEAIEMTGSETDIRALATRVQDLEDA